MDGHEYEVGLSKTELDTPALLVDLAAVERNMETMSRFCQAAGISLRPHAKVHKATPWFSWAQIRLGAIGMTVSKLSEAEVLAASGIRDILIANQIVGSRKIRRLVNLAAYTNVIVAVDSPENVKELSEVAVKQCVTLGVLVEVDIGNNRCGVAPLHETLSLARTVIASRNVRFRGLMGYDGHLAGVEDPDERHRESLKCYHRLSDTRRFVESTGIEVEIVSGGGTTTYRAATDVPGITELQAGSYLFSDTKYFDLGIEEFTKSITILSTIISVPRRDHPDQLAILDVGSKAISNAYGFPKVRTPEGAEIYSMPQEHSRLRYGGAADRLRIGDTVEIWVKDVNGTINMHNKMYGLRNGIVEMVLTLHGRGMIT